MLYKVRFQYINRRATGTCKIEANSIEEAILNYEKHNDPNIVQIRSIKEDKIDPMDGEDLPDAEILVDIDNIKR